MTDKQAYSVTDKHDLINKSNQHIDYKNLSKKYLTMPERQQLR